MKKEAIIGIGAGLGALLLFMGKARADEGGTEEESEEGLDETVDEGEKKEAERTETEGGDTKGRPSNISGDPKGYNTTMFPGIQAVRQWLVNLGYSVNQFSVKPLIDNAQVKKFQRDYNKLADAVAYLKSEYGWDTRSVANNLGRLSVDGTAGKNTLNAMEIAHVFSTEHSAAWSNVVAKAKEVA